MSHRALDLSGSYTPPNQNVVDIPDLADRDGMVQSGMEAGWRQGLEAMEKLLTDDPQPLVDARRQPRHRSEELALRVPDSALATRAGDSGG